MEKDSQINVLQFLIIINGANGKKYKSDYRAILNWVVAKAKQDGYKPKEKEQEYREIKKMSNKEYYKTHEKIY